MMRCVFFITIGLFAFSAGAAFRELPADTCQALVKMDIDVQNYLSERSQYGRLQRAKHLLEQRLRVSVSLKKRFFRNFYLELFFEEPIEVASLNRLRDVQDLRLKSSVRFDPAMSKRLSRKNYLENKSFLDYKSRLLYLSEKDLLSLISGASDARTVRAQLVNVRNDTPLPVHADHFDHLPIQPAPRLGEKKRPTPRSYPSAGLSSRNKGCFAAGTCVLTPNGERPIEELRVGDKILGFDLAEKRVVEQEVLRKFVHRRERREVYSVIFENGQELEVTGEHPVFVVETQSYAQVDNLKAGQEVLSFEKGQLRFLRISAILKSTRLLEVYNIETNGNNNYFSEGVLVHNKGSVTT